MDKIRLALTNCNDIPPYHIDELVETILRGGRKIFAILVLLKGEEKHISRFVRSDGFQRRALDNKLPFSEEALDQMLPQDAVHDFYRLQWEFLAPTFAKGILHRVLDPRICLPFLRQRDTEKEGGFGHIYEVEIHPEHSQLPLALDGEVRFVRKEFLTYTANEETFENELHNLSLLGNLEHPNIVELLGSWTYRGKHNALFPYAEDGDLASFLNSSCRSSYFLEDTEFYRAVSELASAVQVVHKYTSEKLNLSLIGVHHDFRPQNILVHRGSFILADFGLSKFKEANKSSKSLFNLGAGHYLAPECEDYEGEFEKHTISRPSDIWSFGCVLAEIITYMLFGADGTANFKGNRKIKIGGFTTYTFHAGQDKPNPGVVDWLKYLEGKADETARMVMSLVHSMLSIAPTERPTAEQVASSLSYTAIKSYAKIVQNGLELLREENALTELRIEKQRFDSWYQALRSYETVKDPWHQGLLSRIDSNAILKSLIHVRDELNSLHSRFEDALSPQLWGLQDLNDQLMKWLPWDGQERANIDFELQMIRIIDEDYLFDKTLASSSDPLHRKIGLLAAMKHMNRLVSKRTQRCRSDLLRQRNQIKVLEPFEDHSLALFNPSPKDSPRKVLIEWVGYDSHWEGRVGEEMYARMEAIAELLHQPSKPDSFRVLSCLGFFHDSSRCSFGFIYPFPSPLLSSPTSNKNDPRSLHSIIFDTKDSRYRPSLDSRFALAHTIASSILNFHKVGWLHKSVSAFNVIFFASASASASFPSHPGQTSLQDPYIIGFNRSRLDDPMAFTNGTDTALRSHTYQHPRYQSHRIRFRPEFDYHSLGLVLLAIGLWQTLEEMTAKLGPTGNEETVDKLLGRKVPLLSHAMGIGYCEAVRTCLMWARVRGTEVEGIVDVKEEKVASLVDFERLVVEPIARRLS